MTESLFMQSYYNLLDVYIVGILLWCLKCPLRSSLPTVYNVHIFNTSMNAVLLNIFTCFKRFKALFQVPVCHNLHECISY